MLTSTGGKIQGEPAIEIESYRMDNGVPSIRIQTSLWEQRTAC